MGQGFRQSYVCLFDYFYYKEFLQVGFFDLKVDNSFWREKSDFKRYIVVGIFYELNKVYEFVEIIIFCRIYMDMYFDVNNYILKLKESCI